MAGFDNALLGRSIGNHGTPRTMRVQGFNKFTVRSFIFRGWPNPVLRGILGIQLDGTAAQGRATADNPTKATYQVNLLNGTLMVVWIGPVCYLGSQAILGRPPATHERP